MLPPYYQYAQSNVIAAMTFSLSISRIQGGAISLISTIWQYYRLDEILSPRV